MKRLSIEIWVRNGFFCVSVYSPSLFHSSLRWKNVFPGYWWPFTKIHPRDTHPLPPQPRPLRPPPRPFTTRETLFRSLYLWWSPPLFRFSVNLSSRVVRVPLILKLLLQFVNRLALNWKTSLGVSNEKDGFVKALCVLPRARSGTLSPEKTNQRRSRRSTGYEDTMWKWV